MIQGLFRIFHSTIMTILPIKVHFKVGKTFIAK